MQTEAEKHFDSILAQRRATGRKTYGRGLTHTDAYDWNMMALEEAMDLAQYLAAENLRLRQQIEQARRSLSMPPVGLYPDQTEPRFPVAGVPSPSVGDEKLYIYTTTTGTKNGR